jgi:hypothetical protein
MLLSSSLTTHSNQSCDKLEAYSHDFGMHSLPLKTVGEPSIELGRMINGSHSHTLSNLLFLLTIVLFCSSSSFFPISFSFKSTTMIVLYVRGLPIIFRRCVKMFLSIRLAICLFLKLLLIIYTSILNKSRVDSLR